MAKVSIVVPIYNSEKTLAMCLDSILNQTLQDIEILCLDDECADNSRQIIDEYSKKDSRIVPIHLSGKGSYGRALNLGFQKASSEYIGIVESDDTIAPEMYETLLTNAINTNSDISMASYFLIKKDQSYEYSNILRNITLNEENIFNIEISPNIVSRAAYPWKSLYKKSFLIENEIKFREDDGANYQDLVFNACVLSKAKRITGTTKPLYFYNLDNPDSTSNTGKTLLLYPIRRLQTRQVYISNGVFNDNIKEHFDTGLYGGLKFFYERCSKKAQYYKLMRKGMQVIKNDNIQYKYFSIKAKKDIKRILKYPFYSMYKFRTILSKLFTIRGEDISYQLLCFSQNYSFLLRILNRLIPKDSKQICIGDIHDFSQNSRIIHKYLERHVTEKTIFNYLYSNKEEKANLDIYKRKFIRTDKIRTRCLYNWSFKALWAMLRSKTFILTGFQDFNYYKQNVISVWHGMPIKTIGTLEKGIYKYDLIRYKRLGKYAYNIATSDICKMLVSVSFNADPNKVLITGIPRNDVIIDNDKKEIFENLLKLSNYNKVILYAPTYRELRRIRDIHPIFKNIFYCDDYDENDFYKYLEENNILFIFKPHGFDEGFYNNARSFINFNHPNVRYLDNNFFKTKDIFLYELFKYTDILISDFSSISIDYLISKKPVVYLLSGAEFYAEERGFSLEDNYKILMPGLLAYNYAELKNAINDALFYDTKKEERLKAIPLIHKYTDSNSCERIWNFIQELNEKDKKSK